MQRKHASVAEDTRSHLKNRILVQVPPLRPSGIKRRNQVSNHRHTLEYFEELKLGPNTDIGTSSVALRAMP